MANDFILVTVTQANQAQAQQLKSMASQAVQLYATVSSIRDKMTHMFAGADFSRLETEFGLPAGKGQTVFDLLNGSLQAMEGTAQNPNFKSLTELLG